MNRYPLPAAARFALLFLLCGGGASGLASGREKPAPSPPPEWSLLMGYGETHPGFGKTAEKVRVWDINLRRRETLKVTEGKGFHVTHDLLLEAAASYLLEPRDRPPIFALNFLTCWNLHYWDFFRPYIFLGGGPVYTEADIPGMGSRFNGNYQAGLGLMFLPGAAAAAVVEYRYHHVSNGGLKKPNDPLNSSKVILGFRLGW